MLVPTMTPEEIRDDIIKDIDLFLYHILMFQKHITSFTRFSIRKFPFLQAKKVKSKRTNKTYELVIYTPNKYRQKTPTFFVYTKYSHQWGTTYVEILPNDDKFEYRIYTPHFIKRYHERMHLDDSITLNDAFIRFRVNNMATGRMDNFIIDNEEKYYHDKDTEYYANIIPEGACVCERDMTVPDVIIHNTFISREMFFATQEKNAKFYLISTIWKAFLLNYPRQKDALEKEFDKMVAEAENENILFEKVSQFVDKY